MKSVKLVEKVQRRESIVPSTNNPIIDIRNRIQSSKNPNTDRNVRKDTLAANSSSREALRQEFLDLPADHVLNVPMAGRNALRIRQKTKDSASSVLTPMFKDNKKYGGSPSA